MSLIANRKMFRTTAVRPKLPLLKLPTSRTRQGERSISETLDIYLGNRGKKETIVPMLEALPPKGTYTLVISIMAPTRITISERGVFKLKEGYYAYSGSAMGSGAVGLRQRVARHLRDRKTKHWHVDYLLASQKARITAVVACSTSASEECRISRNIQSMTNASFPIGGFGASDCRQKCRSHLVYCGPANPLGRIIAVHRRVAKKADVVRITLDPR